eukprot:scaffold9460_cov49-Phaeocystis_antarctica.AAC.1
MRSLPRTSAPDAARLPGSSGRTRQWVSVGSGAAQASCTHKRWGERQQRVNAAGSRKRRKTNPTNLPRHPTYPPTPPT